MRCPNMSFRRSRDKASAQRQWASFCQANAKLLQRTGLYAEVTDTEKHFVYFLEHGWFPNHETNTIMCSVHEMTDEQMEALKLLYQHYREAWGNPVIQPIALSLARFPRVQG
jgi:hypothetical protein